MTVEKMIKIVNKMSEKSLWLTYRKTEQVSEILTTPRESQNPDKKPFLRRKSNPLI